MTGGAKREKALQELRLQHAARLDDISFHGNSMLPFLREGDRLSIDPVRWEEVRVGDIVTYRLEDRFPTARVVGRDGSRLLLKCDNWHFSASHIWAEDLLGRVCARHRGGRTLRATSWRWKVAAARVVARARALRLIWRSRERLAAWRRRARRVRIRRVTGLGAPPVSIRIRVGASERLPTRQITADALARIDSALPPVETLCLVGWLEGWSPAIRDQLMDGMRRLRKRRPSTRLTVESSAGSWSESAARDLAGVPVDHLLIGMGDAADAGADLLSVPDSAFMRGLRELERVRRENDGRRPRVHLAWRLADRAGAGCADRVLIALRRLRDSGARVLVQEVAFYRGRALATDGTPPLELDDVTVQTLREAVKLAERDGIRLRLEGVLEGGETAGPIPELELDGALFATHGPVGVAESRDAVREPLGNVLRSGFREVWEAAPCHELRRAAARAPLATAYLPLARRL